MATAKYPQLLLLRTGESFEQTGASGKRSYTRAGFRYVRKDEHVEYYKVSSGEEASQRVRGYRSILRLEVDEANAIEYFAIERANGFTHLKEGTYPRAYMGRRASYPKNQEIYVDGNIFIHAAEYPEFLDGCIAPGKKSVAHGVTHSKEALAEIIDAIGWKAGRLVPLVVRGYKDTAGR